MSITGTSAFCGAGRSCGWRFDFCDPGFNINRGRTFWKVSVILRVYIRESGFTLLYILIDHSFTRYGCSVIDRIHNGDRNNFYSSEDRKTFGHAVET
ncbi:hypothetical protein HZ326_23803, partial [Fusarium oxysporum f. sp. albedinis]